MSRLGIGMVTLLIKVFIDGAGEFVKYQLCVVLLFVASLVVSCAPRDESRLRSVLVPWPQADRSYQLTPVQIETLGDLTQFSGPVASISAEPRTLFGESYRVPVQGHFLEKADGLLIPRDPITAQAATIYAHLEKLYQFDTQLGVRDLGQWPLQVSLRTQMKSRQGRAEYNNATYDPFQNFLAITPSQGGNLAVDFNAGAIAHEHFHALFQGLIGRELYKFHGVALKTEDHLHYGISAVEACPSVARRVLYAHGMSFKPLAAHQYNSYLVRALNEGMADFYGFIYTNNPHFLNPSFQDGMLGFRNLTSAARPFLTHSEFTNVVEVLAHTGSEDGCFPYAIGSHFSNFLYQLSLAMDVGLNQSELPGGVSGPTRMQMMQAVVDALPEIGEILIAQYRDASIPIELFAKPVLRRLPKTDYVCRVMRDSFSSSSLHLPECEGKGLFR